MSNEISHKIVLFSENDFGGDALVVMRSIKRPESPTLSLESINYPGQSGDVNYGKFCSFINVKGGWDFSTHGNSSRNSNVVGRCFTSNIKEHSSDKSISFFNAITSRDYGGSGEPQNGYYGLVSPKRRKPKTKYQIKFFPNLDSFTISPSPDFIVDDDGFRWVFLQDDELNVNWVPGVTNQYLEFGRHLHPDEVKDRSSPIALKDGSGNLVQPLFVYNIQEKETIYFMENKNATKPGLWFFNFCCLINGVHYKIDPEMQSGTGTKKN